MAGATVGGLASGLKTNDIIAQMMEIERVPLNTLQSRQDRLKQVLATWQEANTRILAMKINADKLVQGSNFDAKSITCSDDSILSATGDKDAVQGTYFLKVTQLTRAHQLKSSGFANATDSVIGTGTIDIKTAAGETKSVKIDSTNNSLQGVANAINKAGAGVSASIINDGSAANPYKLIITSNTSGSDGAITINSALTDGTNPTFSDLQTAQDTQIIFGDGPNAITVTKKSNTVNDLIPGLTLNLKAADTGKTIKLDVSNDVEAIKGTIKDFVTQYNNFMDFMKTQTSYDPDTKACGLLFGDSSLQMIQSDLRSKIANPVSSLGQSMKMLANIGITASSTDDKLIINDSTLTDALKNNLNDVRRLFSSVGEADNSSVSLIATSNNSKMSGPNGYIVNVTKAPTATRLTAGAAQTDKLAKDELMTINGILVPLTKDMSQADVVNKINEYTAKTGVVASMTDANGSGTGNFLTLKRTDCGGSNGIAVKSNVSNQTVTETGDPVNATNTSGFGKEDVSAVSPGGESKSGNATLGTDIEGTINGEPADGKGNVLTGKSGNKNTDGLQVRVDANSPGNYGALHITKGVAGVISDYVDFITTPKTGVLSSAQDTVNKQIDDLADRMTDMNDRLTLKQEQITNKFALMESTLSKLQTQGDAISQFAAAGSKKDK